jgi:aminocarboxymuconate-semialdehyde decarboxylase
VPETTIDVHCHYLPPRLIERLRSDGRSHSIEIVDGSGELRLVLGKHESRPMPSAMTDLQRRVEWMDDRGIDVQLLSAWVEATAYELPPDHGIWLAECLNDAAAEDVSQQPDRFRAMASVPLQAPESAAAELRRAVTDLGMIGVEIASTTGSAELDDPSLEPFWTAAEELAAPVLVHPHQALGDRRYERYFLWNLLGNPAEEAIAAAHLIFGGVLDRHPGLIVCLTHGGGFLPYQIGRVDRGYDAVAGATAANINRPPSDYLGRFFYDTITHDADALRFLVEKVGAERVVLGSDYPFPMGDPDPVASLAAVGLDERRRAMILCDNAAAAFGLTP